jgi:hypothetical protein
MKNINEMIHRSQELHRIQTKIAFANTRQINHILRNELRWVIYHPSRIFFSQLPKASILR